jgi:tetratricopeptide (TPR) repeat protein
MLYRAWLKSCSHRSAIGQKRPAQSAGSRFHQRSGLVEFGYVYVSENDYSRAIASYRKAAELEPLRPKSFFNLGYIYASLEDFSQAKDMNARVVKLEPDYLDEALFNLAMVQEQLGERSQWVNNLRRAMDINPANTTAVALLDQIQQDKE